MKDLRKIVRPGHNHHGKVVEVIGGSGYTVFIKFSPDSEKDYSYSRLYLERLSDEEKLKTKWYEPT